MELTLKAFPLKVVNIPWRNNNLSTLHTDPPLSEQGETFIGIYLIVLGKSTVMHWDVLGLNGGCSGLEIILFRLLKMISVTQCEYLHKAIR